MFEKIQLRNCPLTGLEIKDSVAQMDLHLERQVSYSVIFEKNTTWIGLCVPLFNYLTKNKGEETFENYNKVAALFFGKMSSENYTTFFEKIIHFNCQIHERKKSEHLNMHSVYDDIIKSNNYPQTRKHKIHLILEWLKENQKGDGIKVKMENNFKCWSSCYMSCNDELVFYLKELESQKLIDRNEKGVNLTFAGFGYIDGLSKLQLQNDLIRETYQIGLSFAGENREYVDQVFQELTKLGISVFYDNYEQIDLWGKDLYTHLNKVYKSDCQYCIIFISKEYAAKLWTRHELSSAQARAFKENREYILPVRFDSTELPGMNETVSYIDATKYNPRSVAEMAVKKLNKNKI